MLKILCWFGFHKSAWRVTGRTIGLFGELVDVNQEYCTRCLDILKDGFCVSTVSMRVKVDDKTKR